MLGKIKHRTHMVSTVYGDSDITYGGDTIPDEFRHLMMGS